MNVNDHTENYCTGWIKLFRAIKNKGWYQKSEYVHLWIHLLIKANHKGKEYFMNNETIKIERGQLVTGRKKLSSETGISESKIQRILKCFESEQQIEQQTNSRNRIITILSYSEYQDSEHQIEQQANNKRTTSEQLVNTNKNVNNIKNDNNVKNLEERKQIFSLHTQEINFKDNILDDFTLNDKAKGFIPYWTEHGVNDKKMKFEKTKSFDISRRLHTWKNNAKKFKNKNDNEPFNKNTIELRDW